MQLFNTGKGGFSSGAGAKHTTEQPSEGGAGFRCEETQPVVPNQWFTLYTCFAELFCNLCSCCCFTWCSERDYEKSARTKGAVSRCPPAVLPLRDDLSKSPCLQVPVLCFNSVSAPRTVISQSKLGLLGESFCLFV